MRTPPLFITNYIYIKQECVGYRNISSILNIEEHICCENNLIILYAQNVFSFFQFLFLKSLSLLRLR